MLYELAKKEKQSYRKKCLWNSPYPQYLMDVPEDKLGSRFYMDMPDIVAVEVESLTIVKNRIELLGLCPATNRPLHGWYYFISYKPLYISLWFSLTSAF